MAENKNLELYEKVRKVPQNAQKPIQAGRLKGMTDINPMWRIKTLTEQFGICGIGWYPEIVREWIEPVNGSNDVVANVEIKLYIKVDGEWSKGIAGIGGSKLASTEKNGLYINDECYKSALTDAISVACKELGIGADVYWNKDTTKYNDVKVENFNNEPKKAQTKSEPKKAKDPLDEMTMEQKIDGIKKCFDMMEDFQQDFMDSLNNEYGYQSIDDIELKDVNEICRMAKKIVMSKGNSNEQEG